MKGLSVLSVLGGAACALFHPGPDTSAPMPFASRVATAPAPPVGRVAMQTMQMNAQVVELRSYVTFGTDGRVLAVCTVAMRADSSLIYMAFPDAAFVQLGARCQQPD